MPGPLAGCSAASAVGAAVTWATTPSTIELERATNPFLRAHEPAVAAAAVAAEPGADPADPVAVFAALRAWKNRYR